MEIKMLQSTILIEGSSLAVLPLTFPNNFNSRITTYTNKKPSPGYLHIHNTKQFFFLRTELTICYTDEA
jgi:hypothetical protein